MWEPYTDCFLPYYNFGVGTKNLNLAKENGYIIENEEYVLNVVVPAISEEYLQHREDNSVFMGQ